MPRMRFLLIKLKEEYLYMLKVLTDTIPTQADGQAVSWHILLCGIYMLTGQLS